MRFNPDKCEVLIATNKKSPIHSEYTIHGQILNQTDSAKYLGLNIHKSISWDNHIDKITKTANSTLAFLGRNVSRCPTTIKAQCSPPQYDLPQNMHSAYGAPAKKTASTRLRQYNVEPPGSLQVDSALVDAALRKSGLISNGCSGLIIYLCGLRQIRPYIKWKRIIKK